METHPHKPSNPPTPDQHLADTRIVAQEIVTFLETIYHAASFLKTLPSLLRTLPSHITNQPSKPLLTQRLASLFEVIYHTGSFFKTLYLFTASDFPTFALPTILFGLFGALSGPILTTNASPSFLPTLSRIPSALLLIWTNLLVFNISNQRTPASVAEDRLNKPSRPIPSGRLSIEQARQLNLLLVPVVLALSCATGVCQTTLLLLAMQWMYNDLRGCDESLLLRNALIALGYALYSTIALRILSAPHAISPQGYVWIAAVALVMFGTQHICDIKDAPGDALRGRRSAPLVMGDAVCRWSVAVPVVVCSAACPALFRLGAWPHVFTLAFGAVVAGRTLFLRSLDADRTTWKLWAAWTCGLFVLPLIARVDVGSVDVRVLWEVLAHYACPGHDCAEKLNVLAVSGVAVAVKGSSLLARVGVDVERNMTVVPSISVEVVA